MSLQIVRNSESFLKRLFVMQQRKKLCDAEVTITNKISVHSVVLAASSEFFEQQFIGENNKNINLQNIDSQSVESLIDYCYNGNIKIDKQNWKNILSVANLLIVPEVIEGCTSFAKMCMDTDNCVDVWKFAKKECIKGLEEVAYDFLCSHFEKASQTNDILKLDLKEIIELLDSDLNVSSEIIVLSLVKRWLNHDISNRLSKTNDVLKHVKLLHIPQNVLIEDFKPLCNLDPQCHVMLLEAIQWQTAQNKPVVKASCTQPRLPHSVLIVIGGNNIQQSNTMEIYDMKTKTWSTLPEVKFTSTDFGCVLYDDKIIVAGGREGNNVTTLVMSYDPKSGTLTTMPPLLTARWLHEIVKFEKYIYAVGGRASVGDEQLISDIERWDPVTNKWKYITRMLKHRDSFKAAVLGNEIFIIGGIYKGVHFKVTDAYNLNTGTWRQCAELNVGRIAFGVTEFGGYLYVVGGQFKNQLKSVEKYDPSIDKWINFHDFETPQVWQAVGDCWGSLMIVGGWGPNSSYSSIVSIFDTEKNQWVIADSIKVPRSNHRILQIPRKLMP